jgi:hypothetical protein
MLLVSPCKTNSIPLNKIVYTISNLPDSVSSASPISFTIKITNTTDTTITLIKSIYPIEIFIKQIGSTKFIKQNVNTNSESTVIPLGPKKELNQEIAFPILCQKDTILCPKVNYNECKTIQDSILANIVGLCSKVCIDHPISKGIYQLIIYINITEISNIHNINRIIKIIKIL